MKANKTFVDSSLARGLTNSAIRTTRARDDEQTRILEKRLADGSPARGRAVAYRRGVESMRIRLSPGIVLEHRVGSGMGRKSDQHVFVTLDSLAAERYFGIGMFWLRARDFSIVDFSPLKVSQHACESIFQRLGTTQMVSLEAELTTAIGVLIRLWSQSTRPEVDRLLRAQAVLVPTTNGALFVSKDAEKIEKPHLIAKTWVDSKKLGPDQLKAMERIANDQLTTAVDKYGNAIATIGLPADPWPEATMLMAEFGRVCNS